MRAERGGNGRGGAAPCAHREPRSTGRTFGTGRPCVGRRVVGEQRANVALVVVVGKGDGGGR